MRTSIVVPTRNRSVDLRTALESIINQSFVGNYEIVIVDNGSTDDTAQVSQEWMGKVPNHITLKYYFESVPGLLSGRHKGAELSSGEIIIFIDDDIRADYNWLENVVKGFEIENVQMVGGPSYGIYEMDPPSWTEQLWIRDNENNYCGYYSLLDFGDKPKFIDPSFVWGLNFAISRKVFYECGGFHPDCIPASLQKYQGDGETGLSEKFKARGYKAWYQPLARVGHLVSKDRLTLDYIYKRQYYQGVCDSYALIRKKELVGMKLMFKHSGLLKRFLKDKIVEMFPKILLKDEFTRVMRLGYLKGFWFHQKEAATDPKLVEWILKKDYWDYRLPGIGK